MRQLSAASTRCPIAVERFMSAILAVSAPGVDLVADTLRADASCPRARLPVRHGRE